MRFRDHGPQPPSSSREDAARPATARGDEISAHPFDTTTAAHHVQAEIYRRLGGQGRVAIAFRLNEAVRHMAVAGIQSRHPHYDEVRVRQALARLLLGDTLTRAAWPNEALVDP